MYDNVMANFYLAMKLILFVLAIVQTKEHLDKHTHTYKHTIYRGSFIFYIQFGQIKICTETEVTAERE